jgi:tryptophanyl-tRNA synthetase
MAGKKIVVSGMRPTGKLHLGHYFGVLKNWIQLQDEYQCYFFVADWHALTTEYADPKQIKEWSRDMVLDWMAVGLDPEKCTLFLQSQVPEHAELQVLLGMITPISWLERVPSYKELKQELKDKDLSTYGFLGYPLLQTADVAIYDANLVPVGQDQVAHLELSREIVRRFNHLYGETLVEPQPILTEAPKLPGIDGRKMSKSYNNAIFLTEPMESVQKKISNCITDPNRLRRSDPGNPDICTIFAYHQLFTPPEKVSEINIQCRSAQIGCVEDKKIALESVQKFLKPIAEKRKALQGEVGLVEKILKEGAVTARQVAQKKLEKVYRAMGLL